MFTHRVERRGPNLRVVLDVPLGDVQARLEQSEARAQLDRWLSEYLVRVQQDIWEVAAMLRDAGELGTVKWFDPDKGYGFIRGYDRQDIFVHHRNVVPGGYSELRAGQRVRFRRRQGRESIEAVDVEIEDVHNP